MRGNLCATTDQTTLYRSIPARAGEPGTWRRRLRWCRVYPRACGGTTKSGSSRTLRLGLSPRVRGNRCCRQAFPAWSGSIPARAGEPRTALARSSSFTVYPRACGGTSSPMMIFAEWFGLSPRVRGNPHLLEQVRSSSGSIPARAGEPRSDVSVARNLKVYPRACGGTCPSMITLV